jgi:hypothetical protein
VLAESKAFIYFSDNYLTVPKIALTFRPQITKPKTSRRHIPEEFEKSLDFMIDLGILK